VKTHGYCLTINNPKESDWLPYLQLEPDEPHPFGWTTNPKKEGIVKKSEFRRMHGVLHKHGIQYIIYGKEIGKNETLHYQMFVVFRRTTSFNKVKKIFPRAHIEHARGTFKEAADYCKKQEKYYEYGYDVNVCKDNIQRDIHLMDQASEESDLRADVAALSLNIERIENAIKEQTALLERLIPKEPSWKELSEAYNLDLIESEE
jgi:hypothetical protein